MCRGGNGPNLLRDSCQNFSNGALSSLNASLPPPSRCTALRSPLTASFAALLLDSPLVCPSVTFLLLLPFTIPVLSTWLQSQTSQQRKARGMQTSPSGANYIFSSPLTPRRDTVKQLETKLTNNFLLPVFLLS